MLYALAVPNPHRDHTERFVWSFLGVIDDQLHDAFDLGRAALLLTINHRLLVNQHVRYDTWPTRSGKRDKAVVVDEVIRKRYQRLILAAVVPCEVFRWQEPIH